MYVSLTGLLCRSPFRSGGGMVCTSNLSNSEGRCKLWFTFHKELPFTLTFMNVRDRVFHKNYASPIRFLESFLAKSLHCHICCTTSTKISCFGGASKTRTRHSILVVERTFSPFCSLVGYDHRNFSPFSSQQTIICDRQSIETFSI